MTPTIEIALWGSAFVATHVVLAHPGIRDALVGRLGLRLFQATYSLVALVCFVPYVLTWWGNRHAGELWWHLRGNLAIVTVAEVIIVAGFALVIGGSVDPAPSSIMHRGHGSRVRGMAGITRAPVLTGAALIAIGHLLVNGWTADVAFWSSLLGVAIVGGLHQDWRKAKADEGYAEFRARTTFLPVPRVSAARTLGARAAVGMTIGIALAISLRLYHAQLFGG